MMDLVVFVLAAAMTVFPTCLGVGVGLLPLGLGLVAVGGSVCVLALENTVTTTIDTSYTSFTTTAATVSGPSSVAALKPTLNGDDQITTTPTALFIITLLPTGSETRPTTTTLETITILDIPISISIPTPSVMITLTDNATTVTVAITSPTNILSAVSSPSTPHPLPPPPAPPHTSGGSDKQLYPTGFIVVTVFACLGASWFIFCVVVLLILRHRQHQKDRRREGAVATMTHRDRGLDKEEDTYTDTINLDHTATPSPFGSPPARHPEPALPSPTLQSTPINAPSPPALHRRRTRPHLWFDPTVLCSTPQSSRHRTSSLMAIPPSPSPETDASVYGSLIGRESSSSPPPPSPPPPPPPSDVVAAAGASFMTPEEVERWGRFGEDINPQPDEYWSVLSFGDASEVFGLVERPVGVRHSV